jgi:hypothetical protein
MAPMILVLAALLLPMVLGWVWLCAGFRRAGLRGIAGAVAVQLSVVTLVIGLLIAHPIAALVMALMPPLMVFTIHEFLWFDLFLSQIMPVAVTAGLVVFALCLAVRRVRRWSLVPALLAFLTAGMVAGERVSQREMCRGAAAAGISEFRRNTLFWSLRNAPADFQFDIHALAERGGRRLGWSYKTMGWYDIPPTASVEVDARLFDCPP